MAKKEYPISDAIEGYVSALQVGLLKAGKVPDKRFHAAVDVLEDFQRNMENNGMVFVQKD